MAALADIYIKVETLERILQVLKKKNEKGVSVTLSLNDKSNTYGSNVAAFVSQSKEDREAKKDKFPVGFGKVFWTDGTVVKGEKPATSSAPDSGNSGGEDNLPF